MAEKTHSEENCPTCGQKKPEVRELKDCHFCGKKPSVDTTWVEKTHNNSNFESRIECENTGEHHVMIEREADTECEAEQLARDAWGYADQVEEVKY